MSYGTDIIKALQIVADWVDDLPQVDTGTAFVHSTAIRDAVDFMQRQATCNATLREQLETRRQAEIGVAQKVMRYRAVLRDIRDALHAANRPTMTTGLRVKLRDVCDRALEGDA